MTDTYARQRWQYRMAHAGYGTNLTELLNDLGQDGWELVSVEWDYDSGRVPRFVFKRRMRPISPHVSR